MPPAALLQHAASQWMWDFPATQLNLTGRRLEDADSHEHGHHSHEHGRHGFGGDDGGCLGALLGRLSVSPHGCMQREDLSNVTSTHGSSILFPRFPVYVLNAPWLHARKAFMRGQLGRLGAADVTWLLCMNRDDVDGFTAAERACAYPCAQLNRYQAMNKTTSQPVPLMNGTLSLALKHKLACYDLLHRGLTAALILEDDAVLPPDLWAVLAALHVPRSADIFWMGSYSRRSNVGAFGDHSRVDSETSRAPGIVRVGAASLEGMVHERVPARSPASLEIRQRNASRFPVILGAVGYIMFRSGALLATTHAVTTAADTAISLMTPRKDVIHPNPNANSARKELADGTCEGEDGTLYEQRAAVPTEQYGPKEWVIWPLDPGERAKYVHDSGATHGQGGGA